MNARILLIEDEDDLRDNVADLLELEGYDVLQASDGRAGLALARTEHPDLVLCDVMMPEMDGPAVLHALRADPDTQATPFIFVTAQTESKRIRIGMNLGADDYVLKPFTDAELLHAVSARLSRHRALVEHEKEATDRLRSDIAQNVPHELRTPLVNILGCTQLLRDEWRDLDEAFAHQLLDDIYRAGIRLERFVENFSLYVQLELAGRDDASRAAFAVGGPAEARDVLTTQPVAVAATRHNRPADVRVDATPGLVRMASTYLSKLVAELVDNALKFSPVGTPIHVTGRCQGQMYVIVVQDGGCGLSAEQQQHVAAFVQFNRGQHEQQGLGLGLHLSRTLTHLHGGTLTLESTPGKGTRVTVHLPQA